MKASLLEIHFDLFQTTLQLLQIEGNLYGSREQQWTYFKMFQNILKHSETFL